MTACTINHAEADALPEFLCRTCHPALNHQARVKEDKEAPVNSDPMAAIHAATATRMERRNRRRLRAEVKELRDQLAKLEARGDTPKSQLKALGERLASAERELYLVT